MKHLDLFSGIGGFALAARNVWGEEYENVGFVDNDEFCQKVIAKNFPNTKIYGDIKQFNAKGISADLITGGFPCQPFSSAGEQRGKEDDRDLWPEMFRVIRTIHPAWVVGENVAGFIGMELDRSISDLESEGYAVQTFVIPASAVNAPHRRYRVWIIANSKNTGNTRKSDGLQEKNGGSKRDSVSQLENSALLRNAPHSASDNGKGSFKESKHSLQPLGADPFLGAWEARQSVLPEAVLCRADDGIPNRLDRTKALGNAIVPQVAEEIFKVIKQIDEMENP